MKYVAAIQTPVINQDVVTGWVLRVQAEQDGFTGIEEVTHQLPVEEHVPLDQWSSVKLQELLTKVGSENNMLFKATQKVMDQIAANASAV